MTALAPAPAISAGLRAQIVLAAIAAASDIVFASQQDASAMCDQLLAALDQVIADAATQAATMPQEGAQLWRSLIAVRDAVAADYNAQIGRLPPVVQLALPAAVPVWHIAQYLAGDVPSTVFATYQDIVARNGIRHPGLPVNGPVEVLA
jgi:hypothetical protein